MAIKANVQIEGFSLDDAYCRIVTAEIRRRGQTLVCDCVVDILSAAAARAPIQKRAFHDIPISDDGSVGVRRQLYIALKANAMFADAEDA